LTRWPSAFRSCIGSEPMFAARCTQSIGDQLLPERCSDQHRAPVPRVQRSHVGCGLVGCSVVSTDKAHQGIEMLCEQVLASEVTKDSVFAFAILGLEEANILVPDAFCAGSANDPKEHEVLLSLRVYVTAPSIKENEKKSAQIPVPTLLAIRSVPSNHFN